MASTKFSKEEFVDLPDSTKICYQTFGSRTDSAIVLVAGGSQSMLLWSDEFIRLLNPQSNPHFIIRYDMRDTGRSTSWPAGQAGYTLDTLCSDLLGLLDALAIKTACLVGFSMGGALAWITAARQPDRVRSLALISTSPVGTAPRPDDNLLGLNPDLATQMAASLLP